jgi:hypothetical protein
VSIKTRVRDALTRLAPETMTRIQSTRSRAHALRMLDQWGVPHLTEQVTARYGMTVQAGPFKGMRLSEHAREDHLSPYLLGTFETEVQPWVEQLLTGSYSLAIDLGARLGYYAVGTALRRPDLNVIAFETDRWARDATNEAASINGVSGRVAVHGYCTPEWLAANLPENALIICDIDGGERPLLCEEPRAKTLDSATLLIEIHDHLAAGTSIALHKRFLETHDLETVHSIPGSRTPSVDLSFLSAHDQARACCEIRDPLVWMLCVPRG